ncbi:MAG TPA: type II toxin-antitoxin system ParD family antitoxin [Acidobacteriaceae bacterium]|nr:type II toxin-antitoxin system ParD family antitoxin [Acidobacteriaceae bacterium]
MPSRNIHLTKYLDKFVADKIENGQYANASEVIRAGLLSLRDREEEHQAKLEALRTAILNGINSGVAENDVIGELRERIRKRAAEAEKDRKRA